MDYYGNLNKKRLRVVDTYDVKEVANATQAIGFINSKGLLFDYTLKVYNEGIMHYSGKGIASDIHPCDDPIPWVVFSDCWMNMKHIKKSGVNYYIGEFEWNKKVFGVLMELPRISDDKTFTWRTNRKYGTLEATIKKENFEYLCIVKADGNALIEVKYTNPLIRLNNHH